MVSDQKIKTKFVYLTNKKKKISIAVILLVFLAIFFLGGFFIGKLTSGKISLKVDPDYYKQTALSDIFSNRLVEQVWTILRTDYVDKDKLDEKEMFYSALKGFVAGAGDAYTVLLDPELSKEFDEQISGEFEGIGAEIGLRDGIVTVIAPLAGTPAEQAGLLSGDKIYSVDNTEVIGMTLDKVVRMIRGPKGTNVTLLIARGDEESKDVVITRGVIEIKSVEWEFLDNGIVHVEFSSFNEDTLDLFKKLAKEISQKNTKGIILDMRNNPGGLLNVALDVCSYWIEDDLLLIEKFGDGRDMQYTAGNRAPFKNIPTVVLINMGSASGSEIVAGALQDYEIGEIIGEQSFGKGSVQALKKLPDGSSLKVTIAKWLTPKGRSINDEGIAPDLAVELTYDQYLNKEDPQLDEAIKQLTN